jgi:hypothetical protein
MSGFSNRRPVNLSDCVSGLERLRKRGVRRIYTGSGLRRVTPYVQFVLLYYLRWFVVEITKWVREGARSRVSLSHGWLKVEEVRECSSWEEKEKDKVEKLASLSRGPCSPFYQTRGAGYIGEEGEGEGLCMHAGAGESRLHGCSCQVPVPCILHAARHLNASVTWCMHG